MDMTEDFPQRVESAPDPKEQRKAEIIGLARELSAGNESFSWPGIDPDTHAEIKAGDEQYPGYTTPIDELVERFKAEGVKVVLGKYADSGNVFVLPAGSNDIEQDSISPKLLVASRVIDGRLKKLIVRAQEWAEFVRV
jgi:hypothetical protein